MTTEVHITNIDDSRSVQVQAVDSSGNPVGGPPTVIEAGHTQDRLYVHSGQSILVSEVESASDASPEQSGPQGRLVDLEIEARFTYHPPKDGQPLRYARIRDAARELAYLLRDLCPESRELSIAMTHLDEVVMFANASIARRSEK